MTRPSGRLGPLLEHNGYQVAYFNYPSDRAIPDDAGVLGKELATLHKTSPALRMNIVGHSMGGLVARSYIEGPAYAGGVDHLIMIGTPNQGCQLAYLELIGSIDHTSPHPAKSWSWRPKTWLDHLLNDAPRQMLPGSDFLKTLNNRPRRDGVKYTIIAGQSSHSGQIIGRWLHTKEPQVTEHCWIRSSVHCVATRADQVSLRKLVGKGDGVVKLKSTRLQGVEDQVILDADHLNLCLGNLECDGPPAAWSTIQERLQN